MTRAIALCFIALSLLAGCGREDIEVRAENPEQPRDYHLTDLRAAIAELAKTPASANAYSVFAAKVAALSPRFNDTVALIAERALVFRALPVLEGVQGKSLTEQMDAVATAVWPVALKVFAKPGESARAYLDRACSGRLALDCKRVVHEYRPVMIGAMVWSRLKERAREAYRVCPECKGDKVYAAAIATFEKRDEAIGALAGKFEDYSHPRAWPVAGGRSRKWGDKPLFTLRSSGSVELNGKETKGTWRAIMKRGYFNAGPRVLGVHLRPAGKVRTLRVVLADARAVGYEQVALQVRLHEYPFQLREYRILTGKRRRAKNKGRAPKVNVRDVDTIQVLVQALDAMSRLAGPDPVLRL